MATVSVLTSTRMLAIEAASIVGGTVNGTGHLILTRHDGTTIDAGSVIGPQGVPGPPDVNSVKITTDQTIAGIKTFSSAPVVPAASFPESAIVNLVADLAAKAVDASVVHLTGAETVAGVKTFSSAPVVPANSFPESAIVNLVADLAAAVKLTGNQTIAGIKTFTDQILAAAEDNYFGSFALGSGLGTRLHIGSLGDTNNAYIEAEGAGLNVGLIMRAKGTGAVVIQTAGGSNLFTVTSKGHISSANGASTGPTLGSYLPGTFSAASSVAGSDAVGIVTLVSTATPAQAIAVQTLAHVTFANAFSSPPMVVVHPCSVPGANTELANPQAMNVTTTGFDIGNIATWTPTASFNHRFGWMAIGS